MSNIPENNDSFNDADLAAMFAADKNEPSNDLDNLILENAQLSQHDSIAPQQRSFLHKYAPLFGTAAVLLIGIAVAPLILQSPESSLDHAYAPASAPNAEQVASKASADINRDANPKSPAQTDPMPDATIDADAEGDLKQKSGIRDSKTIDKAESAKADNAVVQLEEKTTEGASVAQNEKDSARSPQRQDLAQKKRTARNERVRTIESELSEHAEAKEHQMTRLAKSESQSEESIADSSDQSLASLSLQSGSDTLESGTQSSTPVFQAEPLIPNAFAPNTRVKPAEAPDQSPMSISEVQNMQSNQKEQDIEKKYRNTSLLWVAEIKRLFDDEKLEQAKVELALFRKKHPNSADERLLPEALQD